MKHVREAFSQLPQLQSDRANEYAQTESSVRENQVERQQSHHLGVSVVANIVTLSPESLSRGKRVEEERAARENDNTEAKNLLTSDIEQHNSHSGSESKMRKRSCDGRSVIICFDATLRRLLGSIKSNLKLKSGKLRAWGQFGTLHRIVSLKISVCCTPYFLREARMEPSAKKCKVEPKRSSVLDLPSPLLFLIFDSLQERELCCYMSLVSRSFGTVLSFREQPAPCSPNSITAQTLWRRPRDIGDNGPI